MSKVEITVWPDTLDIPVFPHPSEHYHMAEQSKAKLYVPFFSLSLVGCVLLAQSQKCQTERTAFLCLSPWLGWHSGCGTDGRQLHLSGFLYLLFGNQWLHYRRPVQLHSLAVSWAVCSVCLSACQSFSWAVSNWILAGGLIAYCAAFAIFFLFPLLLPLSWCRSPIWLLFLGSRPHPFWLKAISLLFTLPSFAHHHLCLHRQFCCCSHVSVNSQYPLGPNQWTVTK